MIATQFQGAFSDNAYKNVITLIALATAVSVDQGNERVSIIGALFILPFLLFSMYGGFMADRFSKRSVAVGTKLLEVGIMILATVAFFSGQLSWSMAILFLMGAQSAIFGPTKYGILPELLPESRLSWGNGILEMTTFLAIIFGTVAGAAMVESFKNAPYIAGFILVCLALAGTLTSLGISRVRPAAPSARFRPNFVGEVFHYAREARRDRVLWLAVLGSVYFWLLGYLLQIDVVLYGSRTLQLPETRIGYLLAAVALGIGLGSFLAGHLSGNKIEYGLIPLGAVGITIFTFLMSLPGWGFWSSIWLLATLGFSAGFFIVPLNAMLQQRPPKEIKGAIIAMANLLTFVGMLIAAGILWFVTVPLGLTAPQVFLFGSLMTLAATVYVVWLLPDSLVRLILWMLTHTLYRIRVLGAENIPEKGGALFVANHVSFVDAMMLIASTDRFVRFLMEQEYYEHPLIKPLAKVLRVIPVSGRSGPRDLLRALREASNSIRDGEIICIFAEGQITRTGQLLPFRKGFERIMKNVDAPIIPVYLDRLWGSIFSFEKGRFLWKLPPRIPYPVTVTYGQPLPSTATSEEVRQAVQELGTEASGCRKADQQPLQRAFLGQARRHPLRFAAADGLNPKVTCLGLLTRSVFLARRLLPHWRDQGMVGLLLPPSVAAATANVAALLSGRVPVNLNYTLPPAALESCLSQCSVKTVVTSERFLEKLRMPPPGGAVYLEDIAATRSWRSLVTSAICAALLPAGLLERLLGASGSHSPDSLAAILFSSGSTGDPKGVMLSHFNIASNLEAMRQVFEVSSGDRVVGILPFFHAFGLTGSLWFPLLTGMGAVYHPTPFDARTIGGLTIRYKGSILLATPTFLQSYLRRCQPEDFGSLRLVITGAERLSEPLADAFEARFGVRPMEGYGCTECSPIVAVNVPHYRAAGFYQVGKKEGRIGHPLPGVSVRIVDPQSFEILPPGNKGLLLVRGPNVMQGYLGQPEKSGQAFRDGWYVTGDLALMESDGFLTLEGRLSRFAKIAGEMVPHQKVEELLQELSGQDEPVVAVTSVPDARKGERLVVLHTLEAGKLEEVRSRLASVGLSNLWIPSSDSFFQVETIPLLGTGKLDLRRIRREALERTGQSDNSSAS